MADEEKETKQEQPKKKSGKGLMIVVMVVLAVVSAGAGVGVSLLLGGGRQAQAAPSAEAASAPAEPPPAQEVIIPFDTFVVNLADPGGNRFVKATIRAVVSDPTCEERYNQDPLLKARVRDRVLSVLSSKRFEDVSTSIGKEALRREIARELNQLLPNSPVREILFVEFIVQ
ncbi:MAG: hypothetical protein D6718_03725 [Acidobacteria bacterium]|nr:MAG: hypothetical protein D6718_03725 [Acidobacteriota bacterium]